MASVVVTGVKLLENPAMFHEPFKFEITFECLTPLQDDLEWKLTYVGSPDSTKDDQELDSVLIGPVAVGLSRVVFEAAAPNIHRLPKPEWIGTTVVLLECSYRDQIFFRVGYFVMNDYTGGELVEHPDSIAARRERHRKLRDKIMGSMLSGDGLADFDDFVMIHERQQQREGPATEGQEEVGEEDEEDSEEDAIEGEEPEGSAIIIEEDEEEDGEDGNEEEDGEDDEEDEESDEEERAPGGKRPPAGKVPPAGKQPPAAKQPPQSATTDATADSSTANGANNKDEISKKRAKTDDATTLAPGAGVGGKRPPGAAEVGGKRPPADHTTTSASPANGSNSASPSVVANGTTTNQENPKKRSRSESATSNGPEGEQEPPAKKDLTPEAYIAQFPAELIDAYIATHMEEGPRWYINVDPLLIQRNVIMDDPRVSLFTIHWGDDE